MTPTDETPLDLAALDQVVGGRFQLEVGGVAAGYVIAPPPSPATPLLARPGG